MVPLALGEVVILGFDEQHLFGISFFTFKGMSGMGTENLRIPSTDSSNADGEDSWFGRMSLKENGCGISISSIGEEGEEVFEMSEKAIGSNNNCCAGDVVVVIEVARGGCVETRAWMAD